MTYKEAVKKFDEIIALLNNDKTITTTYGNVIRAIRSKLVRKAADEMIGEKK